MGGVFTHRAGVFVGDPGDTSEYPLIARATTRDGGTMSLMGLDLTDYQTIFVYIDGIRASTSPTSVGVQISVDGVLRASGYRYVKQGYDSGNINGNIASNAATWILLTSNVSASLGYVSGWNLQISNCDAGLNKIITIDDARVTTSTTVAQRSVGAAVLEVTGQVDGIALTPDSAGTITNGTMAIYGVKKGARTPGDIGMASLWVGALT